MINDRNDPSSRNESVLALRSDVQAVSEAATAKARAEMAAQALAYHDPPVGSDSLSDLDIAVQLACRRFLTHLRAGDIDMARQAGAAVDNLDEKLLSSMRLPKAWTSTSRPPLFESQAQAPNSPPHPARPLPPPPHSTRQHVAAAVDRPSRPGAFIGLQRESAELLRRHLLPSEVPLDGGSAKCRALDSEILDAHMERHGRSGGLNLLEADWIATNLALYYVTPRVGSVREWSWNEIRRIKKVGGGFFTGTIQIDLVSGSSMRWKLAKSAVAIVSDASRRAR